MQIDDVVQKLLFGIGYELVNFEFFSNGKSIRIFIDKDNGVDIDDCSFVSNYLMKSLPVENIDFERIEVSSPGLDRALKKEKDFLKFKNHEIKLMLKHTINGQKNYNGYIVDYKDNKLFLDCKDEIIKFKFDDIKSANLIPKLKTI